MFSDFIRRNKIWIITFLVIVLLIALAVLIYRLVQNKDGFQYTKNPHLLTNRETTDNPFSFQFLIKLGYYDKFGFLLKNMTLEDRSKLIKIQRSYYNKNQKNRRLTDTTNTIEKGLNQGYQITMTALTFLQTAIQTYSLFKQYSKGIRALTVTAKARVSEIVDNVKESMYESEQKRLESHSFDEYLGDGPATVGQRQRLDKDGNPMIKDGEPILEWYDISAEHKDKSCLCERLGVECPPGQLICGDQQLQQEVLEKSALAESKVDKAVVIEEQGVAAEAVGEEAVNIEKLNTTLQTAESAVETGLMLASTACAVLGVVAMGLQIAMMFYPTPQPEQLTQAEVASIVNEQVSDLLTQENIQTFDSLYIDSTAAMASYQNLKSNQDQIFCQCEQTSGNDCQCGTNPCNCDCKNIDCISGNDYDPSLIKKPIDESQWSTTKRDILQNNLGSSVGSMYKNVASPYLRQLLDNSALKMTDRSSDGTGIWKYYNKDINTCVGIYKRYISFQNLVISYFQEIPLINTYKKDNKYISPYYDGESGNLSKIGNITKAKLGQSQALSRIQIDNPNLLGTIQLFVEETLNYLNEMYYLFASNFRYVFKARQYCSMQYPAEQLIQNTLANIVSSYTDRSLADRLDQGFGNNDFYSCPYCINCETSIEIYTEYVKDIKLLDSVIDTPDKKIATKYNYLKGSKNTQIQIVDFKKYGTSHKYTVWHFTNVLNKFQIDPKKLEILQQFDDFLGYPYAELMKMKRMAGFKSFPNEGNLFKSYQLGIATDLSFPFGLTSLMSVPGYILQSVGSSMYLNDGSQYQMDTVDGGFPFGLNKMSLIKGNDFYEKNKNTLFNPNNPDMLKEFSDATAKAGLYCTPSILTGNGERFDYLDNLFNIVDGSMFNIENSDRDYNSYMYCVGGKNANTISSCLMPNKSPGEDKSRLAFCSNSYTNEFYPLDFISNIPTPTASPTTSSTYSVEKFTNKNINIKRSCYPIQNGVYFCPAGLLPQSAPLRDGTVIRARSQAIISDFRKDEVDSENPNYVLDGVNYWWREGGPNPSHPPPQQNFISIQKDFTYVYSLNELLDNELILKQEYNKTQFGRFTAYLVLPTFPPSNLDKFPRAPAFDPGNPDIDDPLEMEFKNYFKVPDIAAKIDYSIIINGNMGKFTTSIKDGRIVYNDELQCFNVYLDFVVLSQIEPVLKHLTRVFITGQLYMNHGYLRFNYDNNCNIPKNTSQNPATNNISSNMVSYFYKCPVVSYESISNYYDNVNSQYTVVSSYILNNNDNLKIMVPNFTNNGRFYTFTSSIRTTTNTSEIVLAVANMTGKNNDSLGIISESQVAENGNITYQSRKYASIATFNRNSGSIFYISGTIEIANENIVINTKVVGFGDQFMTISKVQFPIKNIGSDFSTNDRFFFDIQALNNNSVVPLMISSDLNIFGFYSSKLAINSFPISYYNTNTFPSKINSTTNQVSLSNLLIPTMTLTEVDFTFNFTFNGNTALCLEINGNPNCSFMIRMVKPDRPQTRITRNSKAELIEINGLMNIAIKGTITRNHFSGIIVTYELSGINPNSYAYMYASGIIHPVGLPVGTPAPNNKEHVITNIRIITSNNSNSISKGMGEVKVRNSMNPLTNIEGTMFKNLVKFRILTDIIPNEGIAIENNRIPADVNGKKKLLVNNKPSTWVYDTDKKIKLYDNPNWCIGVNGSVSNGRELALVQISDGKQWNIDNTGVITLVENTVFKLASLNRLIVLQQNGNHRWTVPVPTPSWNTPYTISPYNKFEITYNNHESFKFGLTSYGNYPQSSHWLNLNLSYMYWFIDSQKKIRLANNPTFGIYLISEATADPNGINSRLSLTTDTNQMVSWDLINTPDNKTQLITNINGKQGFLNIVSDTYLSYARVSAIPMSWNKIVL